MDLLERIMFEHMTKLSQHVGEKVTYNGAFEGQRIKNQTGTLEGVTYLPEEGIWYVTIKSSVGQAGQKIIPIKNGENYISDIKGNDGTYFKATDFDEFYTSKNQAS